MSTGIVTKTWRLNMSGTPCIATCCLCEPLFSKNFLQQVDGAMACEAHRTVGAIDVLLQKMPEIEVKQWPVASAGRPWQLVRQGRYLRSSMPIRHFPQSSKALCGSCANSTRTTCWPS